MSKKYVYSVVFLFQKQQIQNNLKILFTGLTAVFQTVALFSCAK